MRMLIKRGLLVFFRDRGGVFFSILGVIIIFLLFIFFIGDSIIEGLDFLSNPEPLMNSWMVAGMLASASITSSMGAYAIMILDREKKTLNDFFASPLKKRTLIAGYMFTGFFISVIMSLLVFVLGEVYIILNGGHLPNISIILEILLLIILSSFSSSAMICFLNTFIKTTSAYTTLSITIGTLVGFLVGSYVTIGSLPSFIQYIIKFFPPSHSALLFRNIMMDSEITNNFSSLPENLLSEFKNEVGLTFNYGEYIMNSQAHIVILAVSGIIFFLLANYSISRKVRKK